MGAVRLFVELKGTATRSNNHGALCGTMRRPGGAHWNQSEWPRSP